MQGFLVWMRISRPDKTLLITQTTFLIIRSDGGGLRRPEPPAIVIIVVSKYAKRLDLAETIRMVQSRASGRPSLSKTAIFVLTTCPSQQNHY